MFLLTPSQRDVLQTAAGGASNRQIALEMGFSRATVVSQMYHIYKRLGVNEASRCRPLAIFRAIQLGEIDELRAYADLERRRRREV